MTQTPITATARRHFAAPAIAVAVIAAGIVAVSGAPAAAQTSVYIDGRIPVDPRTRAEVDAYFDELENRRRAEAEERERFQRFIYQDNIFGPQQQGRF